MAFVNNRCQHRVRRAMLRYNQHHFDVTMGSADEVG